MSSQGYAADEGQRDSGTKERAVTRQPDAAAAVGTPTVQLLRHLQRTAGNQAVNALLRRYQAQRDSAQRVDEAASPDAPEVRLEAEPVSRELSARVEARRGDSNAGTGPPPRSAPSAPSIRARVHNSGAAHALNRTISPQTGNDLAPEATESAVNPALMADELMHVARRQAMGGDEPPTAGPVGDPHERETGVVGARIDRLPGASPPGFIAAVGTADAMAKQAGTLRIQRAPPAAPAAPAAPGTQPAGGVKTAVHEGVTLTPDPAETRKTLEQQVTLKGWSDTDGWTSRFINMDMQKELQYQAMGGVDPQALKDMRRVLKEQTAKLQEAKDDFIKKFEQKSIDATREILTNSEKQIKDQLTKLGVKEETFLGFGTGNFSMDKGKGTALQAAARELAVKRRDANKAANTYFKARDEANAVFNKTSGPALAAALPQVFLSPELQQRVEKSREDGLKVANEYDTLCREKQRDNPILAAYSATPDAADKLEELAKKPPENLGESVANTAKEKLDNIAKVRGELGGRFSVWKEPHMMDVTKRQMQVESWQSRVLDENVAKVKAKDEETKMLIAAVAIGLGLLAAIPTGGGSLVLAGVATAAAAGSMALSVYGAYESYQNFSLESAAQATDFDKAKAISQGDPPEIFWLALDIVTAIADIHSAAAAFKTLKTLLQEARAAKSAEKLAELVEATKKAQLSTETQSKLISLAIGDGAASEANVTSKLSEIEQAFKQAASGKDITLGEAFEKAAKKLVANKKVAVVPASPVEQMAAIRELVLAHGGKDADVAKESKMLFEALSKRSVGGFYYSKFDIIVAKGEGGPAEVAGILAHELAHQKQELTIGLKNMSLYEQEFQAFAAQRSFLRQLPLEMVPHNWQWLYVANNAAIETHVLIHYPTSFKPSGFSNEAAVDTILQLLKHH